MDLFEATLAFQVIECMARPWIGMRLNGDRVEIRCTCCDIEDGIDKHAGDDPMYAFIKDFSFDHAECGNDVR